MDRTQVNFAQAEGVEPLPQQLKLKTVSKQLSALLWAIIHSELDGATGYTEIYGDAYLKQPWKNILIRWWVTELHRNVDEFPSPEKITSVVKSKVTSTDYVEVFGFIQFLIRQPDCPLQLGKAISIALIRSKAAYRVTEKTVFPISSEEEADAISRAMTIAASFNAKGPSAHLTNAATELTNGNWAASIRESIHSVEAAAKVLEPTASTLGPALAKLEISISLNPALKKAFSTLYGFSSDEKGVRHALVFDEKADVGEREAMFMFGACAAFVSYLISAKQKS